jgi:hypothetical protein
MVLLVLVTVGWLANRMMPGKRIPLMTELPPLRLPVPGNVADQDGRRASSGIWIEVIPLFLIGAFAHVRAQSARCAALADAAPRNRWSPVGSACPRRPPPPS